MGTKVKTSGGLTKDQLMKNKYGKVVSKARSAAAKKRGTLSAWGKAVATARKQLNIKGFVAVGGKTAQGKALYAKAKSLYKAGDGRDVRDELFHQQLHACRG